MRGFFAIGIDGVSKTGNMGNLMRTAQAFGAAFTFAFRPNYRLRPYDDLPPAEGDGARHPEIAKKDWANTSKAAGDIPYYEYHAMEALILPRGCRLVGVELSDDAIDLPSFAHPPQAAYLLGGERTSLRAEVVARCDHLVRIPTRFSLNVATAGAILMYDRAIAYGRFAERPTNFRQPVEALPEHVHGGPKQRRREKAS